MNDKLEDRILIALSIIFALASLIMFVCGFSIYPSQWDMYYVIINLSLFIFFIFSLLSYALKKKNQRHK